MEKERSAGLTTIVIYKACEALLLGATSIALLWVLKDRQELAAFSRSYALEGKAMLIEQILNRLLNVNPRTVEFSGITAGIYAGVTAIEAVGLWYQKTWAEFLVIGLTGIGIFPELFELSQGVSLLKLSVLVINVLVSLYFLRRLLQGRRKSRKRL
ncbi:MAG: DUF2127 domain-containing protein [Oscillatoriophycideae cyanobacterium NC_groundwater_1537_Pr4_S-0.65um_50_18]|nr:DUF2127 domain-containing protein [Oscillatoriophycideae cyanobacterium NC_groundwater_1537_Pr4_S-0.65um_50_18]